MNKINNWYFNFTYPFETDSLKNFEVIFFLNGSDFFI